MIAPPNVPAGLKHLPLAEDGIRYRLDGKPVDGVTDVLRDNGFTFLFVPQDALERGEVVHAALELLWNDNLDWKSFNPKLHGYVRSGERLRDKLGFEVLECEVVHYSAPMNVAGRLDLRVGIDGRPRLWDLKTSRPAKWSRLQTGGYASLLPPSDRYNPRAAIELHEDGSIATVHPHDNFDDIQDFYTLATTTKIRREYGIK